MSSLFALARPYARAAFELAQKHEQLSLFSAHFNFVAAFASAPEVKSLLSSPSITKADKVALLLPPGEVEDSLFGHLLALLASNDRLSVLPQIGELYEQHRADAEQLLKVTVRTAAEIDHEQLTRLSAALQQRFKRVIELDVVLEPALLGGAILDAGDVVIDGSLKGKIARMRQQLVA